MNKLNEALKKAERIVFLTGAGVSVPSEFRIIARKTAYMLG